MAGKWPARLDEFPPCARCYGRDWDFCEDRERWLCTCFWTWYAVTEPEVLAVIPPKRETLHDFWIRK